MVNWLFWPRQSGKTNRLLRWTLQDPDRRMIVHSAQAADYIIRHYQLNDEHAKQIVPLERWRIHDRYGHHGEIAVDNLDLMWISLLGHTPSHVSYSVEQAEPWHQ